MMMMTRMMLMMMMMMMMSYFFFSDPFFPDLWSSFRHTSASAEKHCQVPLDYRQHEAIQQALQTSNPTGYEDYRFFHVHVGDEQRN